MQTFSEFLNEFNDVAIFQLAMGEQWTEVWSDYISIGDIKVIKIVAGFTSTTEDNHTAVVNVMVVPKLNKDGADDQATETVSVYFKDFRNPEDAKNDVLRFKQTIKINQ